MDEAASKPIIEWQSAEAALEDWFERDEKFENLPAALQTLFQRGRLPVPSLIVDLWNIGGPVRKRQIARQRDLQTNPALAKANEEVWQAIGEVAERRRSGTAKSPEHREARDIIVQRQDVSDAECILRAAEARLDELAEGLHLSWGKSTERALFPEPVPCAVPDFVESTAANALRQTPSKPRKQIARIDYEGDDWPIVAEMHKALTTNPPTFNSIHAAAVDMTYRAKGIGNIHSKAARLVRRYKQTYPSEHD